MLKQKFPLYILLFSSLSLYIAIGYGIQRYQTLPLFACYFLLFLIYVWLIFEKGNNDFWTMAAILFRASLLFSVPVLSDDFYRFIWDGRLLTSGHHPFAAIPSYYMNPNINIQGINTELFNKVNSKEYFTVYPPFSQFIFWWSVKLSPLSIYGSMFIMKMIVFTCEIGTLFIIKKILSHFNQPTAGVQIYALNPLVIIELTGNLHFEGVMIFFLLLGFFFLLRNKTFLSSVFYAISICTKLIPVIFLPLLIHQLGWKKAISYCLMTGGMTIIIFLPLLNQDIVNGFFQSIGYYFQHFEFNASIYYLIRETGYLIYGYNIIQTAGWALGLVSGILILLISFNRIRNNTLQEIDKNFFTGMLWCMLIFFLFTTTLHPWYMVSLVMISAFTPYRFPVLWSGLIFMTYAGYTDKTFNENLPFVAFEYILVIGYLFYEKVWINSVKTS